MSDIPAYKEVNFSEFKIQALKVILLMCMAGTLLFNVSAGLNLIDSSVEHIIVNTAFLGAAIALYFWLKYRPAQILNISKALAILGLMTFLYSAFQMSENCFRFIWFLPLIIFNFFLLTSRLAFSPH